MNILVIVLVSVIFMIYIILSDNNSYKLYCKMNDSWLETCLNINKMYSAEIKKLKDKIDKLERQINDLEEKS